MLSRVCWERASYLPNDNRIQESHNTTVAVNYPQDTRIWRSMGVVRIHASGFTYGPFFFFKIAF